MKQIDIEKKNLSDDDLTSHITSAVSGMINNMYHKNHRITTFLDNKYIVDFETGLPWIIKGKIHDPKSNHLKKLSGHDISFSESHWGYSEEDVLYNHRLTIVRINDQRGWFDLNSCSYTFHYQSDRYGIYKEEYKKWVQSWSKSLRKRMIKYLYKLQKNKNSEEAYRLFFRRMIRNFDFIIEYRTKDTYVIPNKSGTHRGINKHRILDMIPIIPKFEYREKVVSHLLGIYS